LPGNDLIWLASARAAEWQQRARVIARILTVREWEEFKQAGDPFLCIWAFWACKEAAYKAWQQSENKAFNDPKRIEVRFAADIRRGPLHSVARIGTRQFEISGFVGRHLIFASAQRPDESTLRHFFFRHGSENTFEKEAGRYFGKPLSLRKNKRNHPVLEDEAGKIIEISKSHDGPLLAFTVPER
jgi:hypothetical protein